MTGTVSYEYVAESDAARTHGGVYERMRAH